MLPQMEAPSPMDRWHVTNHGPGRQRGVLVFDVGGCSRQADFFIGGHHLVLAGGVVAGKGK